MIRNNSFGLRAWGGWGWPLLTPVLVWVGILGGWGVDRIDGVKKGSGRPPNVIVIFCDDLGYADVGCFGAKGYRTPNLDRLAREGTRFTSFYVAQAVCSASRAALMTGCYPNRLGIHGALGPAAKTGLNPEEMTLARMFKQKSYATACVGKWHLGRPAVFLPPAHGFDEYFGLPYSNDMWPKHPTAKEGTYPPLPLIEGTNVIETMPDQRYLTRRYTERAVDFIQRNASRPFFLYLAHSMPHVPLFVSEAFAGRSRKGIYGDVIQEIDWSVGEIVKVLKRLGLEEDTLVMFTSDNGPWHSYGEHAGSAGRFREGKASSFEGGIRVPCIMKWPGHVPSRRVVDAPWMTIDLLPSLAAGLGFEPPTRKIDGTNVWPMITGAGPARNENRPYYIYYEQGELQAVRMGRWKLHVPHTAHVLNGRKGRNDGRPIVYDHIPVGLELYDLERDPGERRDVAGKHPEVVAQLQKHAEAARLELGDSRTGVKGQGVREPGRIP